MAALSRLRAIHLTRQAFSVQTHIDDGPEWTWDRPWHLDVSCRLKVERSRRSSSPTNDPFLSRIDTVPPCPRDGCMHSTLWRLHRRIAPQGMHRTTGHSLSMRYRHARPALGSAGEGTYATSSLYLDSGFCSRGVCLTPCRTHCTAPCDRCASHTIDNNVRRREAVVMMRRAEFLSRDHLHTCCNKCIGEMHGTVSRHWGHTLLLSPDDSPPWH
jgi:hypothetical protein